MDLFYCGTKEGWHIKNGRYKCNVRFLYNYLAMHFAKSITRLL